MSGQGQRDRRFRTELHEIRNRNCSAYSLRLWRGVQLADPTRGTAALPFPSRSWKGYLSGKQTPRDGPGSFIQRLEEAVPGSAAPFRSPIWRILLGEPPDATALTMAIKAHPSSLDLGDGVSGTFVGFEAVLLRLELARAEGRHRDFADAVTAVEDMLPRLRFVPELERDPGGFEGYVRPQLENWRRDVEVRESMGLLAGIAARDQGSEVTPVSMTVPPATLARGVLLAFAVSLLWVAYHASDGFRASAAMAIVIVATTCAVSPNAYRFRATWIRPQLA